MAMKPIISLVAALLLSGSELLAGNPPETSDDYTRELMRFSGNIHQFNSIFPQEKVYLEFDNTAYFQGEIIWFKGFVTHATTFKRAPSKVLYVDLLAPSGEVIKQQKLKVVAGQCDGAIALWDAATLQAREKVGIREYPSGFYEIRAYTQNMLDFSREAIFSRVIPVYTKPERPGEFEKTKIIPYKENPLLETVRLGSYESDDKVNLAFYPEGGDLIEGLPCNIAFKATGADGFELKGALVYNNGADTAYTFHDGMGLINITSKGGETVHFITGDGTKTKFSLPKALKSGYSMTALPCTDSLLQVSIARTPDLIGEKTAIAVTCRGEVIFFQEIRDDNASNLELDCSKWPVGVCRLTLYNKDGKILSSRSLFHNNAGFKSPTITVSTDSMSRQPFSLEVMKFKLTDKNGKPLRDRFCLSVRDADDYGNGQTENLQTNLLLSSDLRGYIHNPAWYLAANDEQHRKALNLLTLVQGWERYEWKFMTGQEAFAEKHRIEDSLTMNGWILSSTKRKPLSDIEVMASVMPVENKTMFETFEYLTDSSGYFGFDLSDFYGKAKMNINLMSVKRNGKSRYESKSRIKLERSDKPEARPFLKQELAAGRNRPKKQEPLVTDDGMLLINKDLGIVLDEVDINATKRQFVDYNTFTTWNIEKEAEMELDLGEYTTDVEGYFLEQGILLEWYGKDEGCYINSEGGIEARIAENYDYMNDGGGEDNQNSTFISGSGGSKKAKLLMPFFYVHNQQRLLCTRPFDDPRKIDMIDVKSIIVYDEPMYGRDIVELVPLLCEYHIKHCNQGWFGEMVRKNEKFFLVDIQIKNDRDLLSYRDIRNLGRRTTDIDGFSKPVEFYLAEYPEGAIQGNVDARRTLYWDPNVITDDEGNARIEFYNNGFSKRYTISGAGITASGIPYTLYQNW